MRVTDLYVFTCIRCGAECSTPSQEGRCEGNAQKPGCGAPYRLEWPGAGGGSRPKTISEVYEK